MGSGYDTTSSKWALAIQPRGVKKYPGTGSCCGWKKLVTGCIYIYIYINILCALYMTPSLGIQTSLPPHSL